MQHDIEVVIEIEMKLKFSRFIEAAWEELGAGLQVPVSFSSREFFAFFVTRLVS